MLLKSSGITPKTTSSWETSSVISWCAAVDGSGSGNNSSLKTSLFLFGWTLPAPYRSTQELAPSLIFCTAVWLQTEVAMGVSFKGQGEVGNPEVSCTCRDLWCHYRGVTSLQTAACIISSTQSSVHNLLYSKIVPLQNNWNNFNCGAVSGCQLWNRKETQKYLAEIQNHVAYKECMGWFQVPAPSVPAAHQHAMGRKPFAGPSASSTFTTLKLVLELKIVETETEGRPTAILAQGRLFNCLRIPN